MSSRALRAAAAALLLLAPLAAGETITIADPYPEVWQVEPGASYTVHGELVSPRLGRFSIFPPRVPALLPRVSLPADGRPGDLVLLQIDSSPSLASTTASLAGRSGRPFARTDGFRLTTSSGGERWVALLGIPPGAAPGDYTLTLSVRADVRRYLVLSPFTVRPRAFKNERIALTRQLNDLRTVPDPQKAAEARLMATILSTPHPDALFDTGAFVLPLVGTRRTSGYGDRRTYAYSGAQDGLSIHMGVDIAAPSGTPVSACGRGRVVFAGSFLLTGSTIIIEHLPGLFSLYYHLSEIGVQQDQEVEAGQEIGKVGMTGFATGPHLHWEVQSLGTPVDPDLLVGRPLLPAGAPTDAAVQSAAEPSQHPAP